VTDFSSAHDPIETLPAALAIVPMFQGEDGPEAGPGVAGLGLLGPYAAARLEGANGDDLLVPLGADARASAALIVGLGRRDEVSTDRLRAAAGRAGSTARRFGTVATTLPQALPARRAVDAATAVADGLALGAYRFDRYRSTPERGSLDAVTIVGAARWDARALRAAAKRAGIVADAVAWTRDLVNTPAADMPPAAIADAAQAMADEVGLACRIWDEAELAEGGFGGILGVGKGSANPPRMIELSYRGAGKAATPIALTGKGVAFDSGGLNLKDLHGMEHMKDDMGGAASILGTFKAIARLKPKINVIAAIPCSENMPSGTAQRPGDVIHHYGGVTSEVLNTDAEGRLILADALAFLAERSPQLIVDVATLTGSCMVALGEKIAGVFGTDRALVRDLASAADATGEPIWELPLYPPYRSMIDSSVADIKNTGDRYGGAIAAAFFLKAFVGELPWAHLDIAGPAFATSAHDLGPRGATGVPVRTLVRFVEDRAG